MHQGPTCPPERRLEPYPSQWMVEWPLVMASAEPFWTMVGPSSIAAIFCTWLSLEGKQAMCWVTGGIAKRCTAATEHGQMQAGPSHPSSKGAAAVLVMLSCGLVCHTDHYQLQSKGSHLESCFYFVVHYVSLWLHPLLAKTPCRENSPAFVFQINFQLFCQPCKFVLVGREDGPLVALDQI